MTKALRIAEDFTLPLEAVTQTFAYLAKRGSGKTYTVAVLMEEMIGDELSDKTEYKRSSRDTYLQRLSARRLIETSGRGEVQAAEELFS
jgi:hypothetical protein